MRDCKPARDFRMKKAALEERIEELQQQLFIANQTIGGLTAYTTELRQQVDRISRENAHFRTVFPKVKQELLNAYGDIEALTRELDASRKLCENMYRAVSPSSTTHP